MLPQFVVSPLLDAKVLISTQAEAQEAGRQDALAGLRCNTDAYHFADENSIAGSRLSGDYTFAYVVARGL
jgi:hypothetical protein